MDATVKYPEPVPAEVVLTMTMDEAQVLLAICGSATFEAAEKILQTHRATRSRLHEPVRLGGPSQITALLGKIFDDLARAGVDR